MRFFDNFVMNIFQKMSNKFHVLTGNTCYTLAGICTVGCVVVLLYDLVFSFERNGAFFTFFDTLDLIAAVYYINVLHKLEKRYKESEHIKIMSKERITWMPLRIYLYVWSGTIFFLGMFLLYNNVIIELSMVLFVVLTTSAICFGSCTPLPPCKSKIKEWVKDMLTFKVLALEKSE